MSLDDDLIGDIGDEQDRRGFLALLGGGVAAAGVGGWFLTRDKARGAASEEGDAGPPQRGGHLIFAFDGAAVSKFALDPHNSGFAPHNRIIRAVFDNLTVLKDDGSIGPWLAERWEVSDDGRSYVFHLRKGVTFHDGSAFDAAALKANFDRLGNPENALYSRTDIGSYAGSRVIDSHSLEYRLSEPFAPLLRNLTMTKLAIVSPAAVAKYGKTVGLNPVGTGPFRFDGLTPATEVRLSRNAEYDWAPTTAGRSGPAWLDTLTFRNVPEEATRVAVLESGQAGGADLVPPQNISYFQGNPDFRVRRRELLETNYSLTFNTSKAPWNDEDVRRAVRQGIDVDGIVKIVYLGTFQRAWSSLCPSMFASAETELRNSWRYDPVAAGRALDAKGWRVGPDGVRVKDGRRLTISFLDSQGNREKRLDVVELVRRQLARIGVELAVDSIPSGSLLSRVQSNQYDMIGGASFHADPDMLRHAYDPLSRTAAAGNKVQDDAIIAWVRAAAQESDLAVRADYYRKVQHRIVDRAYAIPIYILPYNLVVASHVHGVVLDAHGFPDFYNGWIKA
ncbi:MAG TPA: ABC transporter substrate-binding protein [Sphingobium sp.]